jgi:hypothetical protein
MIRGAIVRVGMTNIESIAPLKNDASLIIGGASGQPLAAFFLAAGSSELKALPTITAGPNNDNFSVRVLTSAEGRAIVATNRDAFIVDGDQVTVIPDGPRSTEPILTTSGRGVVSLSDSQFKRLWHGRP